MQNKVRAVKKAKTEKKKKSLLRRISNVIFTIVLVVLVFFVAITVVVRVTGNTPSLFGYMIFRVTTGSMEPELNVGEVILVQEVEDKSTLKVGDVVTYMGAVGNYANKLITHKIVKAPYVEDGQTYVITKGVANTNEDPRIRTDQIVGKLVYKIPVIDKIYSFFLTPWGLLITIVLIVIAFGGEFWNVFKLTHQTDDVAEVDEATFKKAIEQYKAEKSPGSSPSNETAQPDEKLEFEEPDSQSREPDEQDAGE